MSGVTGVSRCPAAPATGVIGLGAGLRLARYGRTRKSVLSTKLAS
jgi:hypothetical protein